MTDVATAGPPLLRTTSTFGRRSAISWAALAFAAYLASVAVVRLFDYLTVRAQATQLVEEAGPLYPVGCQGCLGKPELVLVWLTDGRALLVWGLVAVIAAAAVRIAHNHRSD